MKTPPHPGRSHDTPPAPHGPDVPDPAPPDTCAGPAFPDLASLAALRAWYEGLTARAAVTRYLPHRRAGGQSSRALLSQIRCSLAAFAHARQRDDLAALFEHPAAGRTRRAAAVVHAIDVLRTTPLPEPQLTDTIDRWLAPRAVKALRAWHVGTLADLTLRVPRRRRWWLAIPGLGATGARHIEAFFAAHPALTARAWQLVVRVQQSQVAQTGQPDRDTLIREAPLVPWEPLTLPAALDGSHGRFRAPPVTCLLDASNDYDAVQALRAREKQWTSAGALKMLESAVCGVSIRSTEKVDRSTVCVSIFHRRFRMVGSPIKPGVRPCQSVSNHRASRVHFAGLRPPLTHSAVSQNHDRLMGHYAG